jgi:hypothetical protein
MIFTVFGSSIAWTEDAIKEKYRKYLENPKEVYVDLARVFKLEETDKKAREKGGQPVQNNRIHIAKRTLYEYNPWGDWLGPVEDQGQLGTCYAHAAAGLVQCLLHEQSGTNS